MLPMILNQAVYILYSSNSNFVQFPNTFYAVSMAHVPDSFSNTMVFLRCNDAF